MLGEEGKVFIADVKLVRAGHIPLSKPGFANLVRYIKKVKFVGASGLLKQGAHPCSTHRRVCREIQHDR